jgi:hypothetical protein
MNMLLAQESPTDLFNCVRQPGGRGRSRRFIYDIGTDQLSLRAELADSCVMLWSMDPAINYEHESYDSDRETLYFLAPHTTFQTLLLMRSCGFSAQADTLAKLKRTGRGGPLPKAVPHG